MTTKEESIKIHPVSLIIRMLEGAGIAFIVISIFVFGVDNPNPEWGKYWIIKPLILTPLAGSVGGIFYYYMDHLRKEGGWIKIVAILLSLLGFLIILWMGVILGLNGTMWN